MYTSPSYDHELSNQTDDSKLSTCLNQSFEKQSGDNSPQNPIHVEKCEEKPVKYWVKELGLHVEDKDIICNGDWLTDKHVNAMNKLLTDQFPVQEGLQDTLLLAFHSKYQSGVSNFVQVVNVSKQHWVCISNILSPPGVVEIYDSVPNYSFNSLSLKKQVAAILKTEARSFDLHHVDVQRQVGAADCALFAMAFAVNLCFGEDPHVINYKQDDLRSHYIACVDQKLFTRFPNSDRPRRFGRQRLLKKQIVQVFCKCRMPWNKQESEKGPLVQCQMCSEWFHQECMDIEQRIVDNPRLKYHCKLCFPF